MLAGNGAVPGQDLPEQFVQGRIGPSGGLWFFVIHHDVHVDIAVAGMAEAGDGKAVLLLQPRGEAGIDPASRPRGTTMSWFSFVSPVSRRE